MASFIVRPAHGYMSAATRCMRKKKDPRSFVQCQRGAHMSAEVLLQDLREILGGE
jgi:hypothetical protein